MSGKTGRILAVVAALIFGLTASVTAETYVWRNVTVGGGGYVPSVVFSPVEKGLAYMRTDMGGLYRWDDSAKVWLPLMDKLGGMGTYMGIESVAPDPVDANTVYAAVGTYRGQQASIFRSTDRGNNWSIVSVPFHMGGNEHGRAAGERLAVDPNDTSVLYFGSRWDGLQVSADRGANWSKVASFPPGTGFFVTDKGEPDYSKPTSNGVAFVLFDSRSGKKGEKTRVIFAALSDPGPHHLYRSDDAGKSWTPVKGEPGAELLPVHGAIDANGVLYLTYGTGSTGPFVPYGSMKNGAVYKYDIKSGKWANITPQKTAPDATGGYSGLAIDAHHPGTVMVGTTERWALGDTVWRTVDGGKTWQDLKPSSTLDVSETPYLNWGEGQPKFGWWISGVSIDPFDPSHALYTTGATVYATHDIGKPSMVWKPWIKGVEETAVFALASPPAGPPLISAMADVGGFVHDDLAKSPAEMMTNPIFKHTYIVDYAGMAPNVMVRAGPPAKQGQPGFAYSTDYGHNWHPLAVPPLRGVNAEGKPEVKRYDLAGDLAIAVSADGKAIIVMTPVPLITRDFGKSWSPARGLSMWTRIVPDRVNPNRFYAADLQNIQMMVSNDGGNTFVPVGDKLYKQIIYKWATNPGEAWPLMATPGIEGDLWIKTGSNALYHSTDGGADFKFVDGHLSVEALGFGKAAPGKDYPTLFAYGWNSTQRRIFRSTDRGKSWQVISDTDHQYGWTFRGITGDLRVFGRVYVGTDGRGIVYGEPEQ